MLDYGTNDQMWEDGTHIEVRFRVKNNDESILCRVTREAIDDKYRLTDDSWVKAAKEHFDEITDIAGHKIAIGARESDGSILIRGTDMRL